MLRFVSRERFSGRGAKPFSKAEDVWPPGSVSRCVIEVRAPKKDMWAVVKKTIALVKTVVASQVPVFSTKMKIEEQDEKSERT